MVEPEGILIHSMSRKALLLGAALAAGVLGAPAAHALAIATETQSLNFSLTGPLSQTLTYNQFDVSKGNLLSVKLNLNGVHTGSYQIKNALNASNTLNGLMHAVDVTLWNPSLGSPGNIGGTLAMIPGTAGNNPFAPLETQTINFTGQTSPEEYIFTPYLAYFKGASTFQFTLQNSFQTDPTAGFANLDVTNAVYGALNGATLTYEYDVPGPLPLLGAGAAFGWSRKLRRRIKVVGRTANASA